MGSARCHHCGGEEDDTTNPTTGKVTRELRPYGPGGAFVCFQCAMATPGRQAETQRQLMARFTAIENAGDVVTITEAGVFGLLGKAEGKA
jgi:hypothetical protein